MPDLPDTEIEINGEVRRVTERELIRVPIPDPLGVIKLMKEGKPIPMREYVAGRIV